MAGPLDEVGDYGTQEEEPPPPPPPTPFQVGYVRPDSTWAQTPDSSQPLHGDQPVERAPYQGFEGQQDVAPPPNVPIPDTSGYDQRQIENAAKIEQLQKTQEGSHPRYWIKGLQDQQRELALENHTIDLQRRAEMNQARAAAAGQRQVEHQNRLRASDLAARGIPTYRDSGGGLGVATDETGAPLSHFDKSHGIAYDSKGEPKSLEYGPAGAPALKDPFEGLPTRTDPKTGDQYQIAKGLPWKWTGTDEAVKSQRMQEAKDKAVAQESKLIGQKLSMDHADYVAGAKEHELMTKELVAAVPTLQDPKLAGADRDTVIKAIDDHFNTEYGAPEANETNGWFSKELAPSALALRGDIDKRKENAIQTANDIFDLKDHQRALGESIRSDRETKRAEIETLIAHQRGQPGPLDQPQQGAEGEQPQEAAQPQGPPPNFGPEQAPGMLERGNIDYNTRPQVQNDDGSISTVKSFSIGTDKGEVLLPSIADDGHQMTHDEAVQQYERTGQHLGIFAGPKSADAFAQEHHQDMGPPQATTQAGEAAGQPTEVTGHPDTDAAIAAAKAGQKPYKIGDNDTVQFPRESMVDGLDQAVKDGIIDKDYADKHREEFQQVQDKYHALQEAAGSSQVLKALLHGGGVGAAFLAGSIPGAEAGAAGGAALTAPIGEAGGLGPAIGGVLGGLTTGTIAAFAARKGLEKLGDYNDAVKSLNASAELHPVADASGELIAFGASAPRALSNLYKLGTTAAEAVSDLGPKVARQAAIKAVGRQLGIGTLTGAAFETTIRPAFDAVRYAGADALGIQHDQFQGPTAQSILTQSALGALLAGHSLEFKDYSAQDVASVLVRARARNDAGIGLSDPDPAHAGPIAEALQKAGVNLDNQQMQGVAEPLNPQEIHLYNALKEKVARMEASGAFEGATGVVFKGGTQARVPTLGKEGAPIVSAGVEPTFKGGPPAEAGTPEIGAPEAPKGPAPAGEAIKPTTGGPDVSAEPKQEAPPTDQSTRGGGTPPEPVVPDGGSGGAAAPEKPETGAKPATKLDEQAQKDLDEALGGLDEAPAAPTGGGTAGAAGPAAAEKPAAGESVSAPVEKKVEHGEFGKPGYTAVDTKTEEAPKQEFQPSENVKEAENRLWRLTRDTNPNLLRSLQRQYGGHANYQDILDAHIEDHAEKAKGAGAFEFGDVIHIGQTPYKVVGSDAQTTHLQSMESGRLKQPLIQNTDDVRRNINAGHFGLEPIARQEKIAPTSETGAQTPTETGGAAPTAGAAGAEVARPEYQRVALKPVRQRPGISHAPDFSQPKVVKEHLNRLLEQNAGPLVVSGVKVTQASHTAPSGFKTDPTTGEVSVDADKLAVHAPKIAEHGGSPEGWITSALDEEIKHGMQAKAHGPVFRAHYSALHAQLSDDDKKLLEQVYPDDKDPAYQAAELQRMIMQDRSGQTITEAHHRDISRLLPLITGPQSPEMEASISKVLEAKPEPYAAAKKEQDEAIAAKLEQEEAPAKPKIGSAEAAVAGIPELDSQGNLPQMKRAARKDMAGQIRITADRMNQHGLLPTKDHQVVLGLIRKDFPTQLALEQAARTLVRHAKGVTDASGKPSTEGVGVRGEGGEVGPKTPLRQPRPTTGEGEAEKEEKPEPAGPSGGVPTLEQLRAKLREQEKAGAVDDRLLQQIRELEAEQTTEGTRITWNTPKEWIDGFVTLHERDRHPSAKSHRDIEQHVKQLSEQPRSFFESATRQELEQIRDSLKSHNLTPPHGQRAGTPYERIINEVNNALAKSKKPVTPQVPAIEGMTPLGQPKKLLSPPEEWWDKELTQEGKRQALAAIGNTAYEKQDRMPAWQHLSGDTQRQLRLQREEAEPEKKKIGATRMKSSQIGAGQWKYWVSGWHINTMEHGVDRVTGRLYRGTTATSVEFTAGSQAEAYSKAIDIFKDPEAAVAAEKAPKIVEAIKPVTLDEQAQKDLDDALGGLMASEPVRGTQSLRNHAIYHALTIKGHDVDRVARDYALKPEHVEKIYDAMRKRPLMASEPFAQREIPDEKLDAFIKAARSMVRSGVDTPEALVQVVPEKSWSYLQALWDAMGMIKSSMRGTHDWPKVVEAVRAQHAPKTQEPEAKLAPHELLTKEIKTRLLAGVATSRNELNIIAKNLGLEPKVADEAAEAGVVEAARQRIAELKSRGAKPPEIFDHLVRMYDNQPNLTAQTSESRLAQAFSTPLPLGYAADIIAGLEPPTDKELLANKDDIVAGKKFGVYEPTAGHGMLLLTADPARQQVSANELNTTRAKFLKKTFGENRVTRMNAATMIPQGGRQFDWVMMNAPFGTVKDDSGHPVTFEKKPEYDFPARETTKIHEAVEQNGLGAMKDDGRAIIITMGINALDPKAREKAYGANPYWKFLYDNYRVIDHFTVSGDLYKKQGAGWPVDVIVVAGTGKSPIRLPSANSPRILKSWDELKNELGRSDQERIAAGTLSESEADDLVSGALGSIKHITDADQGSGRPRSGPRAGGSGRPEGSGGPAPEPVPEPPDLADTGGPTTGGEPAGPPEGGEPAGEPAGEHEQRGQLGAEGQNYPEPDIAAYRVPYTPKSKHNSFKIFVPTNLQTAISKALDKIESEVGDIDKYVLDKLGYDSKKEPVKKFFSAEQMDALAMAVYAAEKNSAAINGDQGGVGKGRVAAGMMEYAITKGLIPVFLTRDPKLYNAMIEDLEDIGRGPGHGDKMGKNRTPLFTNSNMTFKDRHEKVWKTKDMSPVMEGIRDTGGLPPGFDIIFSSYYQIQSDLPPNYYRDTTPEQRQALKGNSQPPPDGVKMEAFRAISPNALYIMDESHMAAGDSIRAWRLEPLLTAAPAAYYSSATFAKRADSMGIYFRTTLSRAAPTMGELITALQEGGNPLQQATIAMLAEDGLYLRRERDFAHVTYRTHFATDTAERDIALADSYTAGLRKILALSNDIAEIAGAINDLIKQTVKGQIGKARPPRLSSTNFAAKIHNMVSQYLLAIKAQVTVERSLYHINGGPATEEDPNRIRDSAKGDGKRRVVVSVQNTMQSAIETLSAYGLPMSFNGLLTHYMNQQRILTSGRGATKQTFTITEVPDPAFEHLSDQQLSRQLVSYTVNDEGSRVAVINEDAVVEYFRRQAQALFVKTQAYIDSLDLGALPLSPIDYMRNKLEDAGIKTVEITGRKKGLDRDGKPMDIKGNTKAKQVDYMRDFNNGDAQWLLMNSSGSTGISLHASENFVNQEQRAYLISQPQLDINEFMQGTWRVDRTGQVVGPFLEPINTMIPAELRPAAVLERKMGALNANTTSNAKNEMKEQDTDIFNEYGDEVVWDYLATDEYFVEMLGWKKIVNEDDHGNSILKSLDEIRDELSDGQLVAGVTGRLAILPAEQGKEFWDNVTERYKTLIKQLDDTGQNTLKVEAIDMKAETLSSTTLTHGNEPAESAFDGPSVMEHVKGKVGKEPRQGDDVLAKADEAIREMPTVRAAWTQAANAWMEQASRDRVRREAENLTIKEEDEAMQEAGIILEAAGKEPDEANVERAKELYVMAHKMKPWNDRQQAAREQIDNALRLLGETVHIHNARGMDAYGAVVDHKLDLEHPLTPSKQEFTIWVNTTARQIHLPATQFGDVNTTPRDGFVGTYEENAERSNERYIVTGNLLAASVNLAGAAEGSRIITYTDNKNQMNQGILLPVKFNPRTHMGREPITDAAHFQQIMDDGRTATSRNQRISATRRSFGVYEIRVPFARATGEKYWGHRPLTGLMVDGKFDKKGSNMVGKFHISNLPEVFRLITEDLETPLFFNRPLADGGTTPAGQDWSGPPLMASVPAFARDYWNEDVKPLVQNAKATMKEVLESVAHVLTPTYGVNKDILDKVHGLLGERMQVAYVVDRTGEALEKMFNSMPRPDQITFIDRVKQGEAQPTPELQEAADFIRKVDEDSWQALTDAAVAAGMKNEPVKWLANHYRVMWKKIPNRPGGPSGSRGGRSPLRGSRGMAKQHTLDTMGEGIDAGGVPFSYNPITNLKLALTDIWKYTTALKLWAWAKDNGHVTFVRGPFPKLPDGMAWIDDSIADVWFPAESGEGLIHGGKYAAEEGFGRLLNNFLSRDLIRQTKTGRSLMWIKNATTSVELMFSLFHGVFETLETVASNIGLGLSQIYNRGILGKDTSGLMQGMLNILKSPTTPVTVANLGSRFREMAGKPEEFWATPQGRAFLQIHPDARELINLVFAAGHKPNEVEADWKNKSVRAFMDSLKDLKEGSSKNYVGAGLRAFPAAAEFMMGPLFDRFIPNLKIGQFVTEMREALRVNALRYGPRGYYIDRQGRRHDRPTDVELARKVWRLVEDRFGELNYDTLFWNQTFKAAMQLMFRSVTWKFGSIEAFGRAAAGQGKEFIDAFKERRAPQLHRNMAWLFGIFLLTAAIGTVISRTLGKHQPKGLVDYVFPRIDPNDPRVRVSIPTYFKDLVHLLHSPTGYVKASLAGWIGRVAELLSNKDYYGVQIRDTDAPATKQALQVGKHAAESLLPFSVRGYKNLSANQENTIRKVGALFGVNPAPRYIGQTPAEEQIEKYWKGQRTEEGIKPEQFEIQKGKRELVSKLRHGKSVNIPEALKSGTLKPKDIPALYKRAQMGPLASGIDKMSLEDAEKVYAKANVSEKRELAGILARKRANALRRSGRTMYTGF